jgi:D-lactate dehydrogenase (cytochrome)
LVDPHNEDDKAAAIALTESMNRLAIELDGTVSGEHGIGTGKKKYMEEQHGDAYLIMGDIKRTLDPLNIMNPGKIVNVN